MVRPPAWNSLRLAWPPKSSWFSMTRMRPRVPFAIEPGGGEAAEATADYHQVVFLFDRQVVDIEGLLLPAHLVCDFEGARMATAQAGERGRIVAAAGARGGSRRGQACGDGQVLRRSGSRGGRWSWEVLCEAVGGSGSHVHSLLLRMRAERLALDADPQSRAGAEFRGHAGASKGFLLALGLYLEKCDMRRALPRCPRRPAISRSKLPAGSADAKARVGRIRLLPNVLEVPHEYPWFARPIAQVRAGNVAEQDRRQARRQRRTARQPAFRRRRRSLAAGAIGLLLGNKKARKFGGKAITYGGLIAYNNWQQQQNGAAPRAARSRPPAGSPGRSA